MLIFETGLALLALTAIGASVRAVRTDGYGRIPVESARLPVAPKPGFWQRHQPSARFGR
jgi:hypothetical protein